MYLFQYVRLWLLLAFFPLIAFGSARTLPLLPTPPSPRLLCTIRGQSFIDNTEYFNKIIEGKTIFGFHFLPSLTLLLAEGMGLNLGIIWEKHFGHMRPWHGVRPALSIYYSDQHTTFVVGICTEQPATLIEPLYLMRKPFIEGFHFKLSKHKSYLSGWLNWLTLLSKKDNRPETFTLHLDGAYCQDHSNPTITIPFQLAVYHLGGQGILVKDYSLWCGASGLSLRLPYHSGGLMHWASYLLWNRYVKAVDRPFKGGWGQLHTIDWRMSALGIALSYWYAYNFSSENMGYPLYQSIRIEGHKTVHYECIRSLLFLSIYRDWMPFPGVTIQAVFRPYYDFNNRLLEYGFSCKLAYTSTVQLTHHANG